MAWLIFDWGWDLWYTLFWDLEKEGIMDKKQTIKYMKKIGFGNMSCADVGELDEEVLIDIVKFSASNTKTEHARKVLEVIRGVRELELVKAQIPLLESQDQLNKNQIKTNNIVAFFTFVIAIATALNVYYMICSWAFLRLGVRINSDPGARTLYALRSEVFEMKACHSERRNASSISESNSAENFE